MDNINQKMKLHYLENLLKEYTDEKISIESGDNPDSFLYYRDKTSTVHDIFYVICIFYGNIYDEKSNRSGTVYLQ